MTLAVAVTQARLKEQHALSRVRLAIAAHASDPDWLYVLAAIDARLNDLAELLAREDPQVVRDCEALPDAPTVELKILNSDLPRAARIH